MKTLLLTLVAGIAFAQTANIQFTTAAERNILTIASASMQDAEKKYDSARNAYNANVNKFLKDHKLTGNVVSFNPDYTAYTVTVDWYRSGGIVWGAGSPSQGDLVAKTNCEKMWNEGKTYSQTVCH